MSAIEITSLGSLGLVLVLGLALICWTPTKKDVEKECAEWRRREGFDKNGYRT